VDSRAESVRDRTVGERTKSVMDHQHTSRVINSNCSSMDIPGFPNPLNASAASLTSGSSMLTLVSRLPALSSCMLRTLAVSIGLPTSSRGGPSGARGKVALFGTGSIPHCDLSYCDRGLYSIELCGV
jgi:hypothetical protein